MRTKFVLATAAVALMTQQALAEDKAKESLIQQVRERRLRLLDRQKHYSTAVRTIFQPTPSPLKREERLSNIKKLGQRPQPLQSTRIIKHMPKVSVKKLRSQSNLQQPHSFRKIDYLPEVKAAFRRRSIDSTNWEELLQQDISTDKARRLRRIADDFDRKAVRAELELNGLSSYSKDHIKTMDKASHILIDSIKAKLSLLTQHSP